MISKKRIKPSSILIYSAIILLSMFKICTSFIKTINWNKQPIFFMVVLAFETFLILVLNLKKDFLKTSDNLKKSSYLGIVCSGIFLLYLWEFLSKMSEVIEHPDFWNNKLMFFFQTVFAMTTFLVMALSFFYGKNFFKGHEYLIFGIAFYHTINVLTTLTIEEHNPEIYVVLSKCCLLMFWVYHINNFVAVYEKPKTKILVFFGLSGILFTLFADFPKLITAIQGKTLNSAVIFSIINIAYLFYIGYFIEKFAMKGHEKNT